MPTITSNLSTISDGESITNWSGDTFSLEPDVKVQGSNSVSCAQTTNGVNDVQYDAAFNMANLHLRMWVNSSISGDMQTEANNGMQLYLTDGTNTAYWTVAGGDTYAGGWVDFLVDVESTPTSGTVNTSAVTATGLRINTTAKPRNVPANLWLDYWRYGQGVIAYSITTEALNFQDIADEDALIANQWDILQETDGVLFGRGEITLGDTGASNCNFVSLNETIFFVDRVVDAALYKINAVIGTGTTDIDIEGLVCKTVGITGAEITFPSTLTSMDVRSSSFIDMGALVFGKGTLDSVNFTGCGTTTIGDTCTADACTWNLSGAISLGVSGIITNSSILSNTAASAITTTDLADITGNTFESDGTGHAVELTSIGGGSMNWANDDTGYAGVDGSTGNETIYVNVGAGSLTINVLAGYTTPTIRTAGATVTVVSGQVTTTITVKDVAGSPVVSANVRFIAAAGGPITAGTELFLGLTDGLGQVSDTRSLGSDQPITGKVRKSSISPFYKESLINATIDSGTGLNLTVLMISDE